MTDSSLYANPAFVQDLLQQLPNAAAFVVDQDLRYRLAEGQALKSVGVSPDYFVGKTIFEALDADTAAAHEPLYRQALAGEPFANQHTVNGHHFQTHGGPLYNAEGVVYGALAVSYDITDRRQTEEALRESEKQFRAFVTASSDVVYQMNPDWTQMRSLVGRDFIPTTTDPSRTWLDTYIHPDDQPQVFNVIREAIETKGVFELEHRVVRVDGSLGWTHSRAIPLLDEAGEITGWFGTARDVTERRRAEEAEAADLRDTQLLQQLSARLVSEEAIHTVYDELLTAAIALMRADAGTVQIYDAATKQLVLLATRGFGREMTDYFHHVDADSQTACGMALKTNQRTFADFNAGDTDESLRMHVEAGYLSAQSTPLITRSGAPIGMLNTHWRAARHRPTDRELRFLDLLARQAADLIEQRQAAERLQRSADMDAFRVQLADALRPLADPIAIEEAVARILGEHLRADRAYYVELDGARQVATVKQEYRRGEAPSLIGEHPFASYGATLERLQAGGAVVFNDVQTDPTVSPADLPAYQALGLRAFLNTPLIKNGQLVGAMCVVSAEPRCWTTAEIALVDETAERTWAAIELTRAEVALRAAQDRLQLILKATYTGTFVYHIQADRGEPDARMLALFGLPPDGTLNLAEALTQLIHPDDRRPYAKAVAQATDPAGDGLLQSDIRVEQPDGSLRWISITAQTMFASESRQATLMYGVASDITERRQTAAALYRSQARLRAILDSANDYAIFTTDLNQHVTSWNRGAQTLFGYSEQDILHQSVARLYNPQDRQQGVPRQEAQTAIRVGRFDNERWHSRADGSLFYGSGVVTPLHDESGLLVGLLKVMRDLTAQKRAEEALKEADQRKDEFLAMLAHELRNPMSTIRSGLQILTLSMSDDAVVSPTVAMMNRQTNQLVRLVDELLDVSRISRGKIDLHKERVNLVEVVGQAAESVRALYQEQGKRLQVDLARKPIYLEGDATRLTQIVVNLLTNGARYTPSDGQVWLRLIHQTGTPGRQEAILQVRDNGIGLAADQLGAIFKLFVQVDNSLARSQGGLGLGLTLVKRLVELHGGHVEAQSEGLGQGSTFTVHLPTLAAAMEGVPKADPLVSDSSTSDRILVVDDNADAGFTLAMLLKLKGYEAHTRTSGRAGIEAAEALQPSAILLDIGMPDLDGYATSRLIREQAWGRDVVIIALTGYGQEEDRQRTREAGFNGHLVKPVDLAILTNLLTDLLGNDAAQSN